jgi:hypothetical protein
MAVSCECGNEFPLVAVFVSLEQMNPHSLRGGTFLGILCCNYCDQQCICRSAVLVCLQRSTTKLLALFM